MSKKKNKIRVRFSAKKIKHECKKTGRMIEYKDYRSRYALLKLDIKKFSNFLKKDTKKFEKIKLNYSKDSKEYINAKNKVSEWKLILDGLIGQLNFIRPNCKEDINYRNAQDDSFSEKLQHVISPNFDLRFHGTPIYFAEQIIKNGIISSAADRYDSYSHSTDLKGQISVSPAKIINRTIKFYSDITAYERCLPCGCVFAIKPRNKEDANLRI